MSPDLMAFLWGPLAAGHWLLLRQATRVSFVDESRRTDLVNRTPNKGQTLAAFVVYFEGGAKSCDSLCKWRSAASLRSRLMDPPRSFLLLRLNQDGKQVKISLLKQPTT